MIKKQIVWVSTPLLKDLKIIKDTQDHKTISDVIEALVHEKKEKMKPLWPKF